MERDVGKKFHREYEESGIRFRFFCETVKYDETDFYVNYAKKLEGMKAVDFLTARNDCEHTKLYLMEVKNFEIISKEEKHRRLNAEGEDPLHMEIAKKVKDTIAGLVGASSLGEKKCKKELDPYYRTVLDGFNENNRLVIIAFVEGNLSGYRRGEATQKKGLERLIKKALDWIHCEVMMLNSEYLKNMDLNWMRVEKTR